MRSLPVFPPTSFNDLCHLELMGDQDIQQLIYEMFWCAINHISSDAFVKIRWASRPALRGFMLTEMMVNRLWGYVDSQTFRYFEDQRTLSIVPCIISWYFAELSLRQPNVACQHWSYIGFIRKTPLLLLANGFNLRIASAGRYYWVPERTRGAGQRLLLRQMTKSIRVSSSSTIVVPLLANKQGFNK